MKIQPIHEISTKDLNLILSNARTFLKWNIEPRYYHFHTLIDSIKKSMVHFLPENDEDLVNGINDVDEASAIIDTFTEYPHPLKEGLIVLREIFEIVNTEGKHYRLHKMRGLINDYLETIRPCVLEEKLQCFYLTQSDKARRPRTRNGMTPADRLKRDRDIKKDYEKASEKGKISLHGFATKYQKKYNLSPSQIKKIIASKIDT